MSLVLYCHANGTATSENTAETQAWGRGADLFNSTALTLQAGLGPPN